MSLKLYIALLSVLFSCVANTTPIPPGNNQLDPVRTVFQFPNFTFVENLAVRSNGQILLSIFTAPHLFLIDPVQIGARPTLVHNFTSALAVAGIAEYEPDVFAVITVNGTLRPSHFFPHTSSVWSVDLRGVKSQPDNTLCPSPRIYKIADVPEALVLNGISLLSQERGTLLLGDLVGGTIIRLDIKSGDSKVVIADDVTAASGTTTLLAGVNGLHVRDGFVYVGNFGGHFFGKVAIDEDGNPTENGTIIAHTLAPQDQFDDFTFDSRGNAYCVTGGGNSVEKISADRRRQVIIAGSLNSTEIAEPTSAAFGRGPYDKHVLYVTTGGGILARPPGNKIVGGQLVAITTDAYGPQ